MYAFKSYNLSVLTFQAPKNITGTYFISFYRHLLTRWLTWQISCIIAKYIQKTLQSICLHKLYIGTYYDEVHDVIKYMQKYRVC